MPSRSSGSWPPTVSRPTGSSPARRAARPSAFRRYEIDQSWIGFSDRPAYHDAQAIARKAAELYENGEVDRVVIVYNQFVSALVQRVVERDLLPIPQEALDREDEETERAQLGDFIYEPDPEEILQAAAARSTSRPSSTARCSSRPPPSRARG